MDTLLVGFIGVVWYWQPGVLRVEQIALSGLPGTGYIVKSWNQPWDSQSNSVRWYLRVLSTLPSPSIPHQSYHFLFSLQSYTDHYSDDENVFLNPSSIGWKDRVCPGQTETVNLAPGLKLSLCGAYLKYVIGAKYKIELIGWNLTV